MESSGKGAAFFSPRWEGRSSLQEATGARQTLPPPKPATMPKNGCARLIHKCPHGRATVSSAPIKVGLVLQFASALMVAPGTAVCNLKRHGPGAFVSKWERITVAEAVPRRDFRVLGVQFGKDFQDGKAVPL